MDIIYRLIHAPLCCRAFTMEDEDGIYNVYVNDDLDPDAQDRAIQHELEHIRRGHLESDRPVADLEEEVKCPPVWQITDGL